MGSLWLDLVIQGGTPVGVAAILWAVARALRAGPGHFAEWAAVPTTVRVSRAEGRAAEAEANLRRYEAEAALARIKVVAPELTATVVDELGNELIDPTPR